MKLLAPILMLTVGAAGAAWGDEPISNSQASALFNQYGCQQCHSTYTSTSSGPSFKAIAKEYSSDTSAIDYLQSSVLNGSSGVFGDSAMPGVDVPSSDLRAMINWILQLQL